MVVKLEVGLQQTKSNRAQSAICEATIRLLASIGYSETSLNRVARSAGYTKGAVQYHYPTKESLIAATVDRLLSRTMQAHEVQPETVEGALLSDWRRLINTAGYRALMEILHATRTDDALQRRIAEDLLAWGRNLDAQSRGRYTAADGDADDVVMLINMTRSFMRGLLIQEQYGINQEQSLAYVQRWIELIAPLLRLKADS